MRKAVLSKDSVSQHTTNDTSKKSVRGESAGCVERISFNFESKDSREDKKVATVISAVSKDALEYYGSGLVVYMYICKKSCCIKRLYAPFPPLQSYKSYQNRK